VIEITQEQVLYFRARRGHLAGPGAPTAAAAARTIVGAQSQQLPPSLLALSLRTKGRPTAEALKAQLAGPRPKLVRTWGQRDTLFIFDPAVWCDVVAARDQWSPGGRGGPMPTGAMLDKALKKVKAAGGPVTRTDLLGVAPVSFERAIAERAEAAGLDARRLAAARLIWKLAHRGDVCVADKAGTEQTYVLRSSHFPKLSWSPRPAAEAAADLARMYLAVHGPATANDVAHFFGAKVTTARTWLDSMDGELAEVRCGDRNGLVALAADVKTLRARPPSSPAQWPLRLLPLWESMLMAHADKSWTAPDDADRKRIWRKAAYVSAVALDRGRAVATWSHKATRRKVTVEVEALSGWRRKTHEPAVRKEAAALAAHLGLDGAEVKLG